MCYRGHKRILQVCVRVCVGLQFIQVLCDGGQ